MYSHAGIETLAEITSYLHPLDKATVFNLGLILGLDYNRLKTMTDSPSFLEDVHASWVATADDQVLSTGVPTHTYSSIPPAGRFWFYMCMQSFSGKQTMEGLICTKAQVGVVLISYRDLPADLPSQSLYIQHCTQLWLAIGIYQLIYLVVYIPTCGMYTTLRTALVSYRINYVQTTLYHIVGHNEIPGISF